MQVLAVHASRCCAGLCCAVVQAFKGLKSILMSTMFGTLSPEGGSPLLSALRYPIIDPGRPLAPIPQVGRRAPH